MAAQDERMLEKLSKQRILPIIRTASADRSIRLASALFDSGAQVLEVTMTTPHILGALREIKSRCPVGALVGVGTVVRPDQAAAAIREGADFLVSPGLSAAVLSMAAEAGIEALPGVLTPSDIIRAQDLGASAVKLFPASLGGPAYLSALRVPLPDAKYVPTGGILLSDVQAYLDAGAAAVGIGSDLFGHASEGLSDEQLVSRARAALGSINVPATRTIHRDC